MTRELQVTINVEQWHNANSEFLFYYGRTMAEWASVERGLYYWFAGITRLPDGLARAIFYGVRGFAARADMLEAALPFAEKQSPEEVEFIKLAIKKARQFSVFRNAVAHGEPIPVITDDGIHVTMGKAKDIKDKDAITIAHMGAAALNFSRLATAVIHAIPRHREGTTLAECLAQVHALPIQANEDSPKTSEPPPQYPGVKVRVNKKEFRAQSAKPDEAE